jgi:hypothetical protein
MGIIHSEGLIQQKTLMHNIFRVPYGIFDSVLRQNVCPSFQGVKKGCWKPRHPFFSRKLILCSVRYYCSFKVTAPVVQTLTHVSQPSHKSA